jgi:sensor histidine kinase YesM
MPLLYLSDMSVTIHDFLLFFSGMFFLAAFYWLISFLYTRTRNYLILILMTVSTVLLNLNTSGVVLHFEKAELAIVAFVIFSYCLFASEFIGFKKNLSSFHFNLFVVITASIVVFQIFSPIFLSWQIASTISFMLFIASVIYVPGLILNLWLSKRNPAARFVFCTFLPTGIATIVVSLAQIGVLPRGLTVATAVAVCTLVLVWIYGMVFNNIILRNEKEKEHREKEELIEHQNILLKRKVEERTLELETERKRSEDLLIKASQKQMAELELQSLRAQLNPHFMFNSLNAIQELILKEDLENAHTYLARFGKLLRLLLDNVENPFTCLQKEIEFLELYLSIEKLRMPDLQFAITADSTINKNEVLIPNMILQPYIENALWHGLSYKTGDKKLELTIQKRNGVVVYSVKDNGVGRKKSAELKSRYREQHESKGMELLTKRFKLLSDEFGSDIRVKVSDVMADNEIKGTKVSITVHDLLKEHTKNELHDTYNYN